VPKKLSFFSLKRRRAGTCVARAASMVRDPHQPIQAKDRSRDRAELPHGVACAAGISSNRQNSGQQEVSLHKLCPVRRPKLQPHADPEKTIEAQNRLIANNVVTLVCLVPDHPVRRGGGTMVHRKGRIDRDANSSCAATQHMVASKRISPPPPSPARHPNTPLYLVLPNCPEATACRYTASSVTSVRCRRRDTESPDGQRPIASHRFAQALTFHWLWRL